MPLPVRGERELRRASVCFLSPLGERIESEEVAWISPSFLYCVYNRSKLLMSPLTLRKGTT